MFARSKIVRRAFVSSASLVVVAALAERVALAASAASSPRTWLCTLTREIERGNGTGEAGRR